MRNLVGTKISKYVRLTVVNLPVSLYLGHLFKASDSIAVNVQKKLVGVFSLNNVLV